MKKILLLALVWVSLAGCDKDNGDNNNPFIPNYPFSIDLNRNLPAYANLQFAGSPVEVTASGAGVRGLIVMKVAENSYVAYDRACPNQDLSSCSTLTLTGAQAVCPCDNTRYNLFTGQGLDGQPYPLKGYRTEVIGNVVRVSN